MERLLQNDLETTAIMLEADAARLEHALDSNEAMTDAQRIDAVKLYVTARREAAGQLRAARRALESLVHIG